MNEDKKEKFEGLHFFTLDEKAHLKFHPVNLETRRIKIAIEVPGAHADLLLKHEDSMDLFLFLGLQLSHLAGKKLIVAIEPDETDEPDLENRITNGFEAFAAAHEPVCIPPFIHPDSCSESCSPSDFWEGGKCARMGCFVPENPIAEDLLKIVERLKKPENPDA